MYREKTFFAVIPARGGSKGLKHKNIQPVLGRPLIVYTIEAARRSGIFDRVVVSTEAEEIAAVSRDAGAEVPFVRPLPLTTDTANVMDVLLHTLDHFSARGEEFDYLALLQPTSPLRTGRDIREAADLLVTKDANAVVSICEVDHPPAWCNTLPPDGSLVNFMQREVRNLRRQDLPPFYRMNGAIYLARPDYFRRYMDWYVDRVYGYIMPPERSIDIDTALDLTRCECLLKCLGSLEGSEGEEG
jgi:N-acylneuraminate cytidylyltransferase/CMP-N,N'-diacetyllegionaminic acid synthase